MDKNIEVQMQEWEKSVKMKQEFYLTCRHLVILNHNVYSLKVKIENDRNVCKVLSGRTSQLYQEWKLAEKTRDTVYQYACRQAEEIQQLDA